MNLSLKPEVTPRARKSKGTMERQREVVPKRRPQDKDAMEEGMEETR